MCHVHSPFVGQLDAHNQFAGELQSKSITSHDLSVLTDEQLPAGEEECEAQPGSQAGELSETHAGSAGRHGCVGVVALEREHASHPATEAWAIPVPDRIDSECVVLAKQPEEKPIQLEERTWLSKGWGHGLQKAKCFLHRVLGPIGRNADICFKISCAFLQIARVTLNKHCFLSFFS